MARWHLVTAEFPPQIGGVGDYTHLVASGLVEAGDEVHVWCPPSGYAAPSTNGPVVHPELGTLRPADLRRVGRLLDQFPEPRRLLVQWVPHGYGYRSMNVPFCLWLWGRSVLHRDRVDVMVHEPYLAFWEGSWRQAAVALVHRLMTVVLLRAAHRVWIAIPIWEDLWRPYLLGRRVPFTWLPVPSSLPTLEMPDASAIHNRYARRGAALIGHFGTYGPAVSALLQDLLPPVVEGHFRPAVLLLGAGSEVFGRRLIEGYPRIADRVHAFGHLSPGELCSHLAACDLLIQPYPDGVSSRRTSVMAGLSLGRPIVTTRGHLTEPLWDETGAALLADVTDQRGFVGHVERLLGDRAERQRLGERARKLYNQRFDLRHTITALRESSAA